MPALIAPGATTHYLRRTNLFDLTKTLNRTRNLRRAWAPPLALMGVMTALAIGVGAMFLATPPTPAEAHTTIAMQCDNNETTVTEGEDFTVEARGHDHSGDWYAAWWYTDNLTTRDNDYTHTDGTRRSARHWNNIVATIPAVDDHYPELDEQFTVRISNQDNSSSNTSCVLTIEDNDGPGLYKWTVVSEPEDSDGYEEGEVITIEGHFTEPVTVNETDGHVGVSIYFGSNWRQAKYDIGTGTNKLRFNYTVLPGDQDGDGFSIAEGSATGGFTGSGTITTLADGEAITRSYRRVSSNSDHKVNADPFSILRIVGCCEQYDNNGTYTIGQTMYFFMATSWPVDVEDSALISLWLNGNDESVWRGARYESGSGTRLIKFAYTVQEGDLDPDGVTVGGRKVSDTPDGQFRFAGTSRDARFRYNAVRDIDDHKVDGIFDVTSIEVVSEPEDEFSYQEGETIALELTLPQAVDVKDTPELTLHLDAVGQEPSVRTAEYVSGSGTNVLRYEYEVDEDDFDFDGISLPAGGQDDDDDIYGYTGDGTISIVDVDGARYPAYEAQGPFNDHTIGMKEYFLANSHSTATDVYVGDTHYWVADTGWAFGSLLAYNLGTQERDADRDIDYSDQDINGVGGIWSDGETIWIAPYWSNTITAYSLADGTLDEDKNIVVGDTDSYDEDDPEELNGGIWSDGTTMYVAKTEGGLYQGERTQGFVIEAYSMNDGSYQGDMSLEPEEPPISVLRESSNILTYAGAGAFEIWMNDETYWVFFRGGRMFAHSLEDDEVDYDQTLRFDHPDHEFVAGAWLDDDYIWAITVNQNSATTVQNRMIRYKKPEGIIVGNTPLRVETVEITSTPENEFSYQEDETINVALTFSRAVTVDEDLTIQINIGEGDDDTRREAEYSEGTGTHTVTFAYDVQEDDVDLNGITVAAAGIDEDDEIYGYGEDGEITTSVFGEEAQYPAFDPLRNQGSHRVGIGMPDLADGNTKPWGVIVVGDRYWVSDRSDGKLYAYKTEDNSQDTDRDIDVSDEVTNPTGIWTDGQTVWVVAQRASNRTVYAYNLADGTRDSDKDLTLDDDYTSNWGIAGDDETLWVMRSGSLKLEAFNLETLERDSDKDVVPEPDEDELEEDGYTTYDDGVIISFLVDDDTFWVQIPSGKIFAHSLEDGSRLEEDAISNLPVKGSKHFSGMWVDGDQLWAVGGGQVSGTWRLYTYPRPDDIPASSTSPFLDTTVDLVNVIMDPEDVYRAAGEDIIVRVTFTSPVAVTGEPTLTLLVGEEEKTATHAKSLNPDGLDEAEREQLKIDDETSLGSRAYNTYFQYTIAAGDNDDDGIIVKANSLDLNEGSILDGNDQEAILDFEEVKQRGMIVDTTGPSGDSAEVDTDGKSMQIQFTENVTVSAAAEEIINSMDVDPADLLELAFTVTVDGHPMGISLEGLTQRQLELTLNHSVSSDQRVVVSFDNIFAQNNMGLLADAAGNHLETFSNLVASNRSNEDDPYSPAEETLPLQASLTELVIEEGSTESFQINLDRVPDAEVTLSATTAHNLDAVSLSDSVTIAANTPVDDDGYQITITSDDDDDDDDIWTIVTVTATQDNEIVGQTSVAVLVQDND